VNTKIDTKHLRVAWLFPSLGLGNYWHPVLDEFTKVYPQTTVFTGEWPGFLSGFEDAFEVKVVGKMTFVDIVRSNGGYNKGFIKVSPAIAGELLKFKPNVIFTSGFSMWTILALLLKPLGNWQVVIVCDGSSPMVDYRNSKVRTRLRQIIAYFTNAFITNSLGGKDYLTEFLGVDGEKVFAKPYQVPDTKALLQQTAQVDIDFSQLARPIFLFTGQTIPRKGLKQLLQACQILRDRNCSNYTLLVAGDGEQRQELEAFCQTEGLENFVHWLGWVEYGKLGAYFSHIDVFILPTLEDVWGMVVLEAMSFGKPVLCSKWAGASELVIEGENGYLFDPHQPEEIADCMQRLIDNPDRMAEIAKMGQRAQRSIELHTPSAAANFLTQLTAIVAGEL
jgi:glycosyltransferase involved in cell wall biosynthesis